MTSTLAISKYHNKHECKYMYWQLQQQSINYGATLPARKEHSAALNFYLYIL